MKNAARSALMLCIIVAVLSFHALAQDLIIVRPRHEFMSRGLEPALRDKISRGRLVFQFGAPRTVGRAGDPYQTVIVYPQGYSNRPESNFTGRDASGNLYFSGYPVAPSGWVTVRVEPADADVFLDGHAIKADPVSGLSPKTGYPVGKHLVEARKAGLQPYAGEVEVRQASEVHIDIKLTQ